MKGNQVEPGTEIKVPYPFVLTSHMEVDFDDPEPHGWPAPSWKPEALSR